MPRKFQANNKDIINVSFHCVSCGGGGGIGGHYIIIIVNQSPGIKGVHDRSQIEVVFLISVSSLFYHIVFLNLSLV